MDFPTLYADIAGGKSKKWIVSVKGDTIIKQYGQDGGKMITTSRVATAKNKGKKNETTAEEQAVLEAKSAWMKQLDKEYRPASSDTKGTILVSGILDAKTKQGGKNHTILKDVKSHIIPGISDLPLPMLAQTFTEEPKVMKYYSFKNGVYVQPKYDGMRCIAQIKNGKVVLSTRKGKQFPWLKSVREDLLIFLKDQTDVILDGEIYVHNPVHPETSEPYSQDRKFSLIQEACSLTIKEPSLLESQMIYVVYDIIDLKLNQQQRLKKLTELFKKSPHLRHVELSPTEKIHDVRSVKIFHSKYTSKGYEGIILRSPENMYQCGPSRSLTLRKYKLFDDAEFEITGFKEGEGTDKGTVVWRCNTTSGKSFDVRPVGTVEERKILFTNGRNYLGLNLTVKFQGISADGIPRFPVGLGIRFEET